MKYQDTVDYSKIDPLKILAQKAALNTVKNLNGFSEVTESRGESAYVLEFPDFYLASIMEGLGTKSLVSDEMAKITSKSYYDFIAKDTVATAINDLITVGAKPMIVHAYWAAGSSTWFDDKKRMADLVNGWEKACNEAGCVWGGGETPSLSGVIEEKTIDLGCSAIGIIQPKNRLLLGNNLAVGDKIILIESSGIHANGLTLARNLATKLENCYKEKLPSGRMYGEALLDPTYLYAKLISAMFEENIDLHYIVNITGHGWRKLMRHPQKFTYEIDKLPPVPEVLDFIVQKAKLDLREAYATFNMGAGLAIFVNKNSAEKVISVAGKNNLKAWIAGSVKQGLKQVVVKPLNLVYKEESLKLRV